MREELTAGGHPRGANACAPHVLLVRVQADVGTPLAAGVDEAERPEGGGLAADMPREQAHSLVPKRRSPERATSRLWYSDATQKTPKPRPSR